MLFYRFNLFLLIILHLYEVQAKRAVFSLAIDSLNCEVCCDWLKQYHCQVNNVINSTFAFNFLVALNREMPWNTEVNVIFDVRPVGGAKVVRFLNLKLKVCDALANMKTNPLVMIFQRKLILHSNLPMACPIMENVLYNISQLAINEKIIPSYAPNMDFNVTLAFYQRQIYLGRVFCQGSVKRGA